MRQEKLTFGDREFNIKELSIMKETEWRNGLDPVISQIDADMQFVSKVGSSKDFQDVYAEWASRINDLAHKMIDTIISYAPGVLEPEREFILENATRSEVVENFATLMSLSSGIDFLTDAVQIVVASGARVKPVETSVNGSGPHTESEKSPDLNGGSGETN